MSERVTAPRRSVLRQRRHHRGPVSACVQRRRAQQPTQRVTLAGPAFLAVSELYGQLRTMPAPGRQLKSREFAVVRHWGVCPICSAEVDLDSGRSAFPDRL